MVASGSRKEIPNLATYMIFIFASLEQISRCIVCLQEERATLFLVLHLRLSIKKWWMWLQIPAGQGNWILVFHLTAELQKTPP